MSQATNIEWTDATWNPIRGCSRVSEGCRHCYAESVAYRFSGPGQPYEGLVQVRSDIDADVRVPIWNGQIRFIKEHLLDPLKWRKPRRIFVNSMSDLFHENVTDEMLDRIFAVMALCPQHTFQVLTKRPERMLRWFTKHYGIYSPGSHEVAFCYVQHVRGYSSTDSKWWKFAANAFDVWPLPNVWLGVSVENQKAADERIPLLLQTPAAVRFLSVEPLLGPVDVDRWFIERDLQCGAFDGAGRSDEYCNRCGGHVSDPCHHSRAGLIDWVICGGESGPGARPMHPDWARSLRDQCRAAGVPFFFKQWGEWAAFTGEWEHGEKEGSRSFKLPNGFACSGRAASHCWDDGIAVRVGKKAAGHRLDGEVIQQFPEGIACSGGKSA